MSGVLLDTCAVLWLATGAELSAVARSHILEAAEEGRVFVSAISAWELALQAARGRLQPVEGAVGIRSWLQAFVARPGIEATGVTAEIAMDSALLPDLPHRDPADRFLIATARALAVPIVTRDRVILRYAETGHVRCIPC